MQTRSFRGSGEPAWVNASSNACERLGPDPRRALGPAAIRAASTGRTHDRTRPMLHQRKKALVNQAPSTHDPKRTSSLIQNNSGLPTIAAKQATSVIPIVFATAGDPVGSGIVASLPRPGGNITGLSGQAPDTTGKRIELLREIVPGLRRLAILADVGNPFTDRDIGEVDGAARALALEVEVFEIRRAEDIGPAFKALQGRAQALYVVPVPVLLVNRIRINTFALVARLPTMYHVREPVEAAGLISYGPNW